MGCKCSRSKKEPDTNIDNGKITGTAAEDENIVSKQTQTVHNSDGTVTVTEKITYNDGRVHTKTTTTKKTTRVITTSEPIIEPEQTKNSKPEKVKDSGKSGDWTQFEREALAEHNRLRAKHGCPPLKLNKNLCAFATQWAQQIAFKNTLQHRPTNKYGENCYMISGGTVDGATAVKAWYEEIKDYRFGRTGFTMGTGHFSQVVWKGSKELGIGFGKSKSGGTYIVANYDPPGNVQGHFLENVPAPIS